MKKIIKLISLLAVVCIAVSCLAACGPAGDDTTGPSTVDYAASVKLDMSSETVKQQVTVRTFIDGDTTHFEVPTSVMPDGVLKARYLAINTPESTGKIEPYGKTASNFTKEKLSAATSIIIESDTTKWDPDSTGNRYMVWVWYRTSENEEYRNLNIEILQNGLALASSSANNRYGETCMKALDQARAQKLHVFSGQNDPNFYYGEAVELTLKELRANIADYEGISVAFTGVVSKNSGQDGVYVEALDEETGMYNGMYVYYGATASGQIKEMLAVGNEIRIVGVVSVFNGSYQVSGLQYRAMKPDDPANTQLVSTGHTGAFQPITADTFVNGKVDVLVVDPETEEEVIKQIAFAEMALGSSVSMDSLLVKSAYTTDNGGGSDGAMTLTCEVNGIEITVRTAILFDAEGNQIHQDAYEGKTINVKGVVDYYDGTYQIKVLSANDITIL